MKEKSKPIQETFVLSPEPAHLLLDHLPDRQKYVRIINDDNLDIKFQVYYDTAIVYLQSGYEKFIGKEIIIEYFKKED